MNRIKKGAADLTLDYDSALAAIGEASKLNFSLLTNIEVQCITYNVLHLLGNEEFSVRDYACHFMKLLIEHLSTLLN